VVTVTISDGRRLTIPAHHPVFWPVEAALVPGAAVDPVVTAVDGDRAVTLRRGDRIIVDNRLESVVAVSVD